MALHAILVRVDESDYQAPRNQAQAERRSVGTSSRHHPISTGQLTRTCHESHNQRHRPMITDHVKRVGLFPLSLPFFAVLLVGVVLYAPVHAWLRMQEPRRANVEYRHTAPVGPALN